MARKVRSPANEEVDILDDAGFAALAGVEFPSRAASQMFALSPERAALLRALWLEGAVVDRSGSAMKIAADRAAKYGPRPASPVSQFASPLIATAIERKGNTKKTKYVRLVALPDRWFHGAGLNGTELPVAETIMELVAERAAEPEPVVEPVVAEPLVLEADVASAVATALLAQVVEVISSGASAPALSRLERDLSAVEQRLATATAYGERLRRELRETGDELHAAQLERDGLRQRMRTAEHNLKVATSGDAARIIDAEVKRQLDRLMRQTPGDVRARTA